MYYTTELINKILKSEEAQKIIEWMVPVYGESYVVLWLLEIIGQQLDDMVQWSEEYQNQVVPQKATWSLPYWEERYGISTNPNLSIKQRRADVIAKKLARAPVNPSKLENIISNMIGVSTKVTENTGKNHFKVTCEGYLTPNMHNIIKHAINKVKPAHLIYTLSSLQLVYLFLTIGCDMSITYTTGFVVDENYESKMKYTAPCVTVCALTTAEKMQYVTQIISDTKFFPSVKGVSVVESKVNTFASKMSTRTKVPTQEADYAAAIHVRVELWCLDGEYTLDGKRRLNAGNYIINL